MTPTAPDHFLRYIVTNGPSADRIVDSLRYAYTPGVKIPAVFTGVIRPDSAVAPASTEFELTVTVTSVEYESGSEGMFILTARASGFTSVTGFYNANSRTGQFHLIPQAHRK